MPSKFLAELSNDFKQLFETEIGYDVIIYAGETPNVKEIHAHSNILCIRSQYFHTAFSNKWAKKINGKFILKKPNIMPHIIEIIIRFIYCGNIELKNLQVEDMLKLLLAADELNIQQLSSYIQEYLIENNADFLRQNPSEILEIIFHERNAFEILCDFCVERICAEPKNWFNSDKFLSLKPSLLELLLKSTDLKMNEIEIWEKILNWCFAEQKVENDPTKWSKDDEEKIKESLKRFIPLIRFYDIEPEDFFYRVYNFKKILPKDLIHNLLEFHVVPNQKPKSDVLPSRFSKLGSSLLNSKVIPLFASWIDRKDPSYNYENLPYDFKLLHKSNQNFNNGFNATSFHRDCDNKGATIWIAKIQDSTQLIGGYNPLDWNGNCGSKSTDDSFLFNFTDITNITTARLGYVSTSIGAVYCKNNQGPSMGNLYCSNSNNWIYGVNGDCYPQLGISANITVEDVEVFQVIKRQ
ncbi:hypothetical protein GLOIN_2v1557202 [Rhizophagus irregularis DAOM 181602=DAOM 197198]|uniref:Btb/poz domain-containing protein 19-like n=3 Tax=Rhizophagus irregularis TaxID=588596 RepID=A0A015KCX9_RHIIW|nr:hypothetical protein RirG_207740 [Rhizophagus irregularis DAOM 197198w]GBC19436.1 hypothetical protein GLOIN_2v1557202 [Rhizophagus irregularis DAOM 181602=DAOM 197198]